jgi:hypothetical protein
MALAPRPDRSLLYHRLLVINDMRAEPFQPMAIFRIKPEGPIAALCDRLSLQSKADPHGDLKFSLAIVDCAADLLHFKPVDIAKRLGCLANRVAYRLLDAVTRDSDDFDYLVCLVRHGSLLRIRAILPVDRHFGRGREKLGKRSLDLESTS